MFPNVLALVFAENFLTDGQWRVNEAYLIFPLFLRMHTVRLDATSNRGASCFALDETNLRRTWRGRNAALV